MEGLVYLSVRVGCAAYLLYKVWGQKKKVHELCDLLYMPVKKEQMISMSPEPADEKEVIGKTRFVYLDENAGKTAAPYMSQPLEQGTDYIGEDEEIREEDVECLLPLEEMDTSLFDLFISQVGNEEAVNKLLEENLDEDGNPRPLKKEGKRNNGGVDWRELV